MFHRYHLLTDGAGPLVPLIMAARVRLRRRWDDESDAEIVGRVCSGQTAAYAVLVRRYQRMIYAIAVRMVGDHDEADDIAQETFVRAYRSLEAFDRSRTFSTWLCRIAMNLAIDASERRRRHAAESLEARAEAGVEPAAEGETSAQAEADDLHVALRRALDDLPEGMRAAFVLRAFGELSYDEIAETLAVPRGTVMSRLNRARERLQAALRPFADERLGAKGRHIDEGSSGEEVE